MLYPQLKKLDSEFVKRKISEFLAEDIPSGDITTLGTISPDSVSSAYIQAEEDLIFAGEQIIEAVFAEEFELEILRHDGEFTAKGEIIARFRGSTAQILMRERVMLNLLQRLSGIATLARKLAEIGQPYNVRILDTRKTTPGLRLFEKYAVSAGGAVNHRQDLSSGILIKDNHIKAAGSISSALEKMNERNTANLPVEIEVENIAEMNEALDFGVDGILLDNMTPAELMNAVQIIRQHANGRNVFIEASGGINPGNLAEYVKTGVDAISSGAITHSSKNSNIHLEIE